jgi:hypothetical protein
MNEDTVRPSVATAREPKRRITSIWPRPTHHVYCGRGTASTWITVKFFKAVPVHDVQYRRNIIAQIDLIADEMEKEGYFFDSYTPDNGLDETRRKLSVDIPYA